MRTPLFIWLFVILAGGIFLVFWGKRECLPGTTSSERKPIRLPQSSPSLAKVPVVVPPRISTGTKPQGGVSRHHAHRQDIPTVVRDNVDRYKINLRRRVSMRRLVPATAYRNSIGPTHFVRRSFDLHPPQLRSTLPRSTFPRPTINDEVIRMRVSVRQRQREPETEALCINATSPSMPRFTGL